MGWGGVILVLAVGLGSIFTRPPLSDFIVLENTQASRADSQDVWQLVWSEEFDTPGLPGEDHWSYDVGDACDRPMGCGWGNNELQYYTAGRRENARVENGRLVIEARKEKFGSRGYTSARLSSKGNGDWTYGRFEIRAKLAGGRGAWSAIWMLPSDGENASGYYGPWPHSGEIDIMEYVGFKKDTIFGNTHTLAYNGLHVTDTPGRMYLPGVEDAFHTYTLEWHHDRLDFFIDDVLFHSYDKNKGYAEWPFDKPFHLLLNVAVGGNWGGEKGVDPGIWPQKMEVDFIRVYQKS